MPTNPKDAYSQDLRLLVEHTDTIELTDGRDARIAVTPAWQGRVMTSTLAGPGGASFGWLNRSFIAAGRPDPVFSNYGGEDRFWLGPEAGQFGLWFAQGDPFNLAHWRTQEGINAGASTVTAQDGSSVGITREFRVTNASGTSFDCAVQRTIRLLESAAAGELLGVPIPAGLAMVGYESRNVLANAGRQSWTRDGGLLSVWILGQYKPLPRGRVIAPFRTGREADLGPAATTDYFGPIPPDRCRVEDGCVLFTCDGKFRSKIGISPRRSRGVIGSYDPDAGALTVVQFNQPPSAGDMPYVNSLWQIQDRPFAGDAINAYNDGPATPGAGQLGPFYEMETSSPAAELAAGESLTHCHRTVHLSGDRVALTALAMQVLGVD